MRTYFWQVFSFPFVYVLGATPQFARGQTCSMASDLRTSTYDSTTLPDAGCTGRLAVRSDDVRGLWVDNGSLWQPVSLNTVNVLDYPSLNAALSDIGGSTVTLLIPKPVTVAQSVNVPPNVTLLFTGTGQLFVGDGAILTVSGPIQAPQRQIFSTAAAGTLRLADLSTSPQSTVFYTEWFGSDPSGVTESCQAIQTTLDTVPVNSIVQLSQGSYKCAHGLTLRRTVTLRGTHRRYTQIYWTGSTDAAVIHIPADVALVRIEKLGVRLANNGTAAYGIWAEGARAHVQEVFVEVDDQLNRYTTACIRSSDAPVSNEHVYRDVDLPYCEIGIQATNGTNIIVDNALISSYRIGISIGNVPEGESVGLISITNSLFSVPPYNWASSAKAIEIKKGIQISIANNQFDLEPPAGGRFVALDVDRLDVLEGASVAFTGNRVNGNGLVASPISVNGQSAQGNVYIAGNVFGRITSYAVERSRDGGEIVNYGPNTYYPVRGPVDPQLPVINVTSPDVGNGDVFTAADTIPPATAWCSFSNAIPGKRFSVRFSTPYSTIVFDGSCSIIGNGGVNANMAVNDVLECTTSYDSPQKFFCRVERASHPK